MPKLKTHSGTKKRFRQRGSGAIKRPFAFKRHNLRKQSPASKRRKAGMALMDDCDIKIVRKHFMPYGLG